MKIEPNGIVSPFLWVSHLVPPHGWTENHETSDTFIISFANQRLIITQQRFSNMLKSNCIWYTL